MSHYPRIGVTVKSGLEGKNDAVQKIVHILKSTGAEVCFDKGRIHDVPCVETLPCYSCSKEIDLLVVIGGDGTILRALRELNDLSVPLVSINFGTIGFLAEIEINEAEDLLPKLLAGKGVVEQRHVLQVRATRGSEELTSGLALNEAVIAQGNIARLVELRSTINDEPLTTFHADGLIISTPTGSTAYSLAAGGPIVHPGLAATILTPINPHSFSQRPIVVRGDSHIEVEVVMKPNKFSDAEVFLTLDGQSSFVVRNGDIIHTRVAPKTAKFLRRSEDTFFATLRQKLHWGERLES